MTESMDTNTMKVVIENAEVSVAAIDEDKCKTSIRADNIDADTVIVLEEMIGKFKGLNSKFQNELRSSSGLGAAQRRLRVRKG